MTSELLLLTAPPASGKTFLLKELMSSWQQRLLVIVPLRALADECRSTWQDQCDVMTPEEWLLKKVQRSIVVVDEFHLFFYWGDTFRDRMWECFFEVCQQASLVVLLTATLTEEMRQEISRFKAHFVRILWVDCGNQCLKYQPQSYLKIPNRRWLWEQIGELKPEQGTGLIFCQYREEVRHWESKLLSLGFRCWSCVGGEAQGFSTLVRTQLPPDFIIATTVLSHGVNLPRISRVFFTYPVKNRDFWIQMVARGGRKGEPFDVFSVEKPTGLQWNKYTNYLAIRRLDLKMSGRKFFRAIQEWFLKAS